MHRQYFVSNNLDELESIQQDLVMNGLKDSQVHVLSDDDGGVATHHLHSVNSFAKTNVVPSALHGAVVGVILASLALFIAYTTGLVASIGWMPFVFIALVLLGFSTWEGGFLGIQKPNNNYESFSQQLHRGEHVMMIDYTDQQKTTIQTLLQTHPQLSAIQPSR